MKLYLRTVPMLVLAALMPSQDERENADSGDTLILISGTAKPYADAAASVRRELEAKGQRCNSLLWSDANRATFERRIEHHPSAVVAIGSTAARIACSAVPADVPVTYCLVSDPQKLGLTKRQRTYGVSANVPVETQMRLIAEILPAARTVGYLCRSDDPGWEERLAGITAAMPDGLTLVPVPVDQFLSITDALDQCFARRVDIIWTTPDSRIYDTSTIRTLLLKSLRRGVPVFGYSPPFVRAGALVGVGVEAGDQGSDVAKLTLLALSTPRPEEGAETPKEWASIQPPRALIALNLVVAERLSVTIPKALRERAYYVFGKDR